MLFVVMADAFAFQLIELFEKLKFLYRVGIVCLFSISFDSYFKRYKDKEN